MLRASVQRETPCPARGHGAESEGVCSALARWRGLGVGGKGKLGKDVPLWSCVYEPCPCGPGTPRCSVYVLQECGGLWRFRRESSRARLRVLVKS